ncbi:MAG: hypothetical protein QM490_04005 [Candidatus Gracilibacteria bacterium]
MGFSTEVWLFVVANFITFLGYMMYALARYTKLENDVKHIKKEVDDILEMKNVIYKIYAQNEILLNFKTSSSLSPQISV